MRRISIISMLAITAMTFVDSGCKKTSGCTDPSATNYNPNANNDNGTCLFTASAIFYTDIALPATATVAINGLNPSTGNITAYASSGTPACGTSGFANFSTSLTQSSGTPSYPYTVTLGGNTGWSGSVTFSQNTCQAVLLPAGYVTVYTTNNNYFAGLPIAVNIDGFTAQITSISSSVPSSCSVNGCANFVLPAGTNFNYTANTTSNNSGAWNGAVTIAADGNCILIALN